jgi:hypothetical protein
VRSVINLLLGWYGFDLAERQDCHAEVPARKQQSDSGDLSFVVGRKRIANAELRAFFHRVPLFIADPRSLRAFYAGISRLR